MDIVGEETYDIIEQLSINHRCMYGRVLNIFPFIFANTSDDIIVDTMHAIGTGMHVLHTNQTLHIFVANSNYMKRAAI